MSSISSDSIPWDLDPFGSVLDRSRIHRCDWLAAAVVVYHQTSTAGAPSVMARYRPRLHLAGESHRHSSLFALEHPPHSHVRNKLEPGVPPGPSGSRRPRCLDSAWVYCCVFLDRLAAFDRRTGKSVEAPFALWPARLSPNRCLAGGPPPSCKLKSSRSSRSVVRCTEFKRFRKDPFLSLDIPGLIGVRQVANVSDFERATRPQQSDTRCKAQSHQYNC